MGFAMIATPLLALFLDYRSAVLAAAIPLLVLACVWLAVNRKSLRQTGLPWTLPAGVIVGSVAGVALQVSLPERVSLLLLAGLILTSVLMPLVLTLWIPGNKTASLRSAPLFGVLAGMTEAALNVGAPFMVLFAGLARLTRLQLLIALNLCFALGKAIQISLLMAFSQVAPNGYLLAAGVGVCLFAFRIGDRLAGRLPEAGFQRMLRMFLLVMAVLLVVRSQALS